MRRVGHLPRNHEYERQGCQTYGTHVQNGKRKDFLGKRHSLLSQFCFISIVRPASLYCEEYVYIDTYLTAYRLHLNYRCYQIKLRMKCFCSYRKRCEVLTGYLSFWRRPAGDWANMWHWTECFTVLFSNRSSSCPITATFYFLIVFL